MRFAALSASSMSFLMGVLPAYSQVGQGRILKGEFDLVHRTASTARTGSEFELPLNADNRAVCTTASMASRPGYVCVIKLGPVTTFRIESDEMAQLFEMMKSPASGGSKQFRLKDQSVLACRMTDTSRRTGFSCSVLNL